MTTMLRRGAAWTAIGATAANPSSATSLTTSSSPKRPVSEMLLRVIARRPSIVEGSTRSDGQSDLAVGNQAVAGEVDRGQELAQGQHEIVVVDDHLTDHEAQGGLAARGPRGTCY